MPVPLRLITTDRSEKHPLVTRLRRYVALSDTDTATLEAAFERRLSLRKKRDVILEGYESHRLHIAVSGFATRYKMLPNGKRQVLSIILPGDIIGIPSAFFKPSRYSVTTISEMVLDIIDFQKFLEICQSTPSLSMAMLWYSAAELVNYADRITDLGRRSPLERVANFILELHTRLQAAGCATASRFEIPLSQEIIGDLLGLSAPHINRMLHELKAERLISVDRRRITIEDAEGLQLLAQFEPPLPRRWPQRAPSRAP